jgi:hypothetical protein
MPRGISHGRERHADVHIIELVKLVEFTGCYLEMSAAFERLFGYMFPMANPSAVLGVLLECNRPEGTSQKLITESTGIPQPNVSKLLTKLLDHGWIEVSFHDPNTGTKTVRVTATGIGLLSDFEKACHIAVKGARKAGFSRA